MKIKLIDAYNAIDCTNINPISTDKDLYNLIDEMQNKITKNKKLFHKSNKNIKADIKAIYKLHNK